MLIERPPRLYRMMFPGAEWRLKPENKTVYLTFDDGPIPEVTPWVLDILDQYRIPAAFFCVADNVRKHPDIYRMIQERGHLIGNHTYHHLQGWQVKPKTYMADVEQAAQLIDSKLFRPPHGHLRPTQFFRLHEQYRVIMWDVVTRDYSRLQTAEQVLYNVKKYTRNGSIIVFHDSLKSEAKIKIILPQAIEWILNEGYTFGKL
ncbi:MAG: polysaccharide deacetylase family protein [Candidatus Symbiothrix sp.]|nr:polysaccharide deacetylase family protein [Candidatus Symbiothrix sp.]